MPTVYPEVSAVLMATSDLKTSVFLNFKGTPEVQERPRFRRRYGHPVVYDPSARWKQDYTDAAKEALKDLDVEDFPIFKHTRLMVLVSFEIRNQAKDIDNLLKFILDALQDIVYDNDRNIYKVIACKKLVTRDEEKTRIEIREV
jgi:Holliday junction resolvase RusA-like endonuclease